MSEGEGYAVHIVIPSDDPDHPFFDRILDNHGHLDDAIEHAEDVCTDEYLKTGIQAMPAEEE